MRRSPIPVAFYLIPAAALIAILPLLLHGCSCGHDFDFHLVSWMEAAAQFKLGNLHPSWAFSPAWNAGEPRFVFYPPISWTLGASLGLLLPWAAVPVVYTWIALSLSGFGMYALARTLKANKNAALIASVIYVANPYMLFTAYERTAYAELLSAAWMPLLFAAVFRNRSTPLRIAIPIALLWLTNAPAAVMGCYSFAVLALVRLVWSWRKDSEVRLRGLAGTMVSGLVLGLGLAAFYILPAAYERRWVQIAMATIEGMRIEDNFLFHHTADVLHDEVLHTASLIAIWILGAALVLLATQIISPVRNETSSHSRRTIISLSVLAVLIGVLLTPVSGPLWRVVPEMTFLQFPWRLTAVLATVFCAALALALSRFHLPLSWLAPCITVLLLCLVWPAVSRFTQPCDEEDNVAARLAVFRAHAGTDPTDEYTPGEADNEVLFHFNPPFWITEDGNAAASVNGGKPGPVPEDFWITARHDSVLVLNRRAFPAWLIRINGVITTERVERADGLIAVPIRAGKSEVTITYAMTWDRMLGDALSLAALCAAIALGYGRGTQPSR